MNNVPDDDDLRTMLHDAVSDVHPEPGLHRIRERTADASPRASRTWLVGLAALATAAAIVGVVLVTTQRGPDADSGPIASPAATASASSSATASIGVSERALGIYYVGDTPQGPRLYREFHRLRAGLGEAGISVALGQALDGATDSDYRNPWPDGTRVAVLQLTSTGPEVTVSLSNPDVDLHARPATMSAAEADAAVQQLVYTAQAALGKRLPVHFLLDLDTTDTLLGVDVSAPVSQGSALDTLALASISEPAEGALVHGSFTAKGVASSFEANVPWEIRQGDVVVKKGFATADGWLDKLYPWQTDPIDVSDLEPGRYTFAASTDDPSDGEGAGPTTDTRTIIVRR